MLHPLKERPHRLAMLVYPGVAAIDVGGPLEAFELVNYLTGHPHYQLLTISCDGAPVPVAGGFFRIEPTHGFDTAPTELDTVLVAGGATAQDAAQDPVLLQWLRERAVTATRVGSICTGAFVLSAAGLTSGAKVATHWAVADELSRRYPDTIVDPDAVFIESRNVWSSAGMSAGIDLALGMIEKDLGRALALRVARYLVLYLKRSGGQSQFSMHLQSQNNDTPAIERIQQWILENPAGDLSIKRLAAVGAVSERTLVRLFLEKTTKTTGEYIVDVRLRHACGLLISTDKEMKDVASLSGFGTDANMRKVFMKKLGVAPSSYRTSFHTMDGQRSAVLAE